VTTGLLRDRQVRCPRAKHADRPPVFRRRILAGHDAARARVVPCAGKFGGDGFVMFLVRPRGQQHIAGFQDGAADCRDIFRRFALAINHLRETAPLPAAGIHTRKAEIDKLGVLGGHESEMMNDE